MAQKMTKNQNAAFSLQALNPLVLSLSTATLLPERQDGTAVEFPVCATMNVLSGGKRNMPTRILGIESSCDETAAAVVVDGREILSSVVSSQLDIHRKYGGVVPELASREHFR